MIKCRRIHTQMSKHVYMCVYVCVYVCVCMRVCMFDLRRSLRRQYQSSQVSSQISSLVVVNIHVTNRRWKSCKRWRFSIECVAGWCYNYFGTIIYLQDFCSVLYISNMKWYKVKWYIRWVDIKLYVKIRPKKLKNSWVEYSKSDWFKLNGCIISWINQLRTIIERIKTWKVTWKRIRKMVEIQGIKRTSKIKCKRL